MSTQDLAIAPELAVNLVDPAAYADDRLHDTYTWLRANNPLGRAHIDGFEPFWVVTKHADILEISRQNDLFHSGDLPTTLTTIEGLERTKEITGGSPHLIRSLVQMDAPDHPKYRALTQGWFMPQNIRKLEDQIRAIAKASVDRMAAHGAANGGRCDFVRDVAMGFPLHVIMSILGVPEEDEGRMLMLTQELFGAQDPDTARSVAAMTSEQFAMMMQAIVADFTGYFEAISADRRANPREDLATIIANAMIDGEPISPFEATGYYIIVATAGHDTTSSSTAGGFWALAQDPAMLAKLQAEPDLIAGLVDEAIRWTTPVKNFMRSATEDTEIAGQKIAKGDWIMLCYASGNRDEEVFDAPFTFTPERNPNKHLAFGYGAHLCLGQHLAKMEMRILFEELIPRLKSVSLDGEMKLTQSTFVNGPKTLPIKFEMV